MDATNFITVSQASKEAFKTATLLRSLQVNALVRGEVGVGKKTLARYILPSAPIIDAKNHDELLSVLHSSSEVIVANLENVANIKVILKVAKEKSVRIIATALPTYEHESLAEFFSIDFLIPPLRERLEDVEILYQEFCHEVSMMLGSDVEIDKGSFEPDLSENALSLKRQILLYATYNSIDDKALMELIYSYLYKRLGSDDDYRKFLYLYEAPLIKAGLKRFGSQLKLAQILGLNRNTLRKKITNLKEYLA